VYIGPSTFDVSINHSPAIDYDGVDKNSINWLIVYCRAFSEVDEGKYDIISIDIEGGE